MAKTTLTYIDGNFVKLTPAMLEALTPGHFNAKGVFETIRVDRQGVHFLDEHLKRLTKGLAYYKISNPFKRSTLNKIIERLIAQYTVIKSKTSIYRLRLMVWVEGKKVHHALMCLPYQKPTQEQYNNGLKVCLIETDRKASAVLANVKSLDYVLFFQAQQLAKLKGFDDALLINQKGQIFESTKANVFVLMGDDILTPPLSSGCLNGITRHQMIEAFESTGMTVIEKSIDLSILKKASGIMLTNSLFGLIPVDLAKSLLSSPIKLR